MQRVRSTRRRPVARKARFNLRAPFRRLARHVATHPKLYGPALPAVLFLLLAHVVVVPILILGKLNGTSASHGLFGTALVWAVLGFLPFLGLSYLSSFLAARPMRHLLEDKRPEWPSARVESVTAVAYAAGLYLGMFLLIRPAFLAGDLILLACCAAAGLLYWLFHRKLTVPADPPAGT